MLKSQAFIRKDIQDCYHDAYSFIKKEDRMTAYRLLELERDVLGILDNLEYSIAEFEKTEKGTYRLFMPIKYNDLVEYKAALKNKKHQVLSYHSIAKAMFHCEINVSPGLYTQPFILMMKSLECYIQAMLTNGKNYMKEEDGILKKQSESIAKNNLIVGDYGEIKTALLKIIPA